jgi:galactokinase
LAACLQVAELLGCCQNEILALLPPALQAAAPCANQLHLQQRALHVFSESQRVLQFKQICADTSLSDDDKLSRLGGLMDASHASCAGLYECSCAELDALVGVARAAGALGPRLTGEQEGGLEVAAAAGKLGDCV